MLTLKKLFFLAFLQIENDFINITNGFHLNLAIKHNCCLNSNYLHIFSKMKMQENMTEEKTKENRQAPYLTGRMKRECCALLFYGHYIMLL